MSTASIIAFLAFLGAFNVSSNTIQKVSDILYASQASTTQITAPVTLQVNPSGVASVTVQNPTPQPTFGATIDSMPQEDKSDILILAPTDGRPAVNGVEYATYPNPVDKPEWVLEFAVLDSSGNRIKFAPLTAVWTDGDTTGTTTGRANVLASAGEPYSNRTGVGYWGAVTFPATATSVTIASGKLTKTISLVAQ